MSRGDYAKGKMTVESCGCRDAPGRRVPMYAVYVMGPPPMEANQIMRRMKCATQDCERFACTASAPGYGFYCCPECYHGKPHSEACNEQDVIQRARLIPGVPPIDSEVYFAHLREEVGLRGARQLCPCCNGLGVSYAAR